MEVKTKKELVKDIVDEILAHPESEYVTEIFAKDFSIRDGEFTDLICLMIEMELGFRNTTFYHCLNDIEDRSYPFRLILSTEPDAVERSHGIILWKRGEDQDWNRFN